MKFIEIQTVRFATELTKKRRYTNNTVNTKRTADEQTRRRLKWIAIV